MKSSLGFVVLVLFLLCCGCVWAQTDTATADTGVPVQPGPKPAYTYPDTTPSLDFLSATVENSSITLGLGAGFAYDSNAYANTSVSSNVSSNWWLFHVTPSIRIQQFLPKFAWHVSYSGGYQDYTGQSGNTNNSLFSQTASAGFLWQLSKHWQLIADDNFGYSANPFDSFLTTTGAPTMNNPNPVVYTPLSQFTRNNGLMTLTDQLTKVDTLSFSGTANLRRTSTYNLLTSVPFYNLVSYGGRAAYSHQLSARLSLGAGYDYNSLDFGKGQQRSGIQTISMTGSYLIRPNMSISAWVGPEYTTTKSVIVLPGGSLIAHNSLWSASVGANFGWQSARNSVRAAFSRQVSDGGGIIATSQVNNLNGDYRRFLTRKMDIILGGQYFHDVSTTVSNRNFDNFYINAALSYKLAKSLLANATYARVHQSQSNTILLGSGSYSANIVGASVTYTWNHPLGR
jgi:hypothetical protein